MRSLGLLLILWLALFNAGGTPAEEPERVAVHALAGQGGQEIPEGEQVTTLGVVTGSFLEDCGLDGFFLQGLNPAPDGKPSGLFVYLPDASEEEANKLEPGRLVWLQGRKGEFKGRPQLQQVQKLDFLGSREVDTHSVSLPLSDPHRLEGVRLRLEQELTVTGNKDLARYGSLELAVGGRAFRPSNFPPGEGPENPRRQDKRIILDDGCYSRNPEPIPYLSREGTRRVGARVESGLTGILTHAFQAWRIHPVQPPAFERANPRPDPLQMPGENAVRVAAFNAENYFLSLGERGAENKRQLRLQRQKLYAAVQKLKADVLALVEMENDTRVPKDFIRGLREKTQQPWRLVDKQDPGKDVIKVSLAYREDRVQLKGEARRDRREVHDRSPLLAAFRPTDGGEPFSVAAVHFKSKIDCPQEGKDSDTAGTGCWNQRRMQQARALTEFIEHWRGEMDGPPVLVAGDLNAYGDEDPMEVLRKSGKRDLMAKYLPWRERYTYVYQAESGYLDHLWAGPELVPRVKEVYSPPINADEPPFLEYGHGGPQGRHLEADPYRASDHDPVVVDLQGK